MPSYSHEFVCLKRHYPVIETLQIKCNEKKKLLFLMI